MTIKLKTFGSRAEVMHGNAKKTSGGLTKVQLKYNKNGKIVSKKASTAAKRSNNLVKAGYVTQPGVFGVIHCDDLPKCRSPKRRSPKCRSPKRRTKHRSPKCRTKHLHETSSCH